MLNWANLPGKTQLNRLAQQLRTSENAVLMALAGVLGLAVGIGILFFREGIEIFHELFAVGLTETLFSPLIGSVSIILSLSLAGFIVGAIMQRFIGEERHHGVAGVMEAVALAGARLRYTRMPFKAVAAALSLGAGASVGPEDPSVQIGANLGSWFGQRLRLNEDQVRLLVAAGAASAVAAAFKAPIAGVFFALEVILNGAFETRSFGVVVLAAVVSAGFTQAIEPAPEMGPFAYTLGSPLEIPLFIPLGILLAFVSVVFMRAVNWQYNLWHHLPLTRPVKTALAGALVGIIALFLPGIMGPGRETMSAVLGGETNFTIVMLLALAGFKLLMTAVSLASGFVGGIFAPSLFVGIMLGSVYGRIVSSIFSVDAVGDPQAYAIAGMAAVMAGIVRSPITAIMLVFELTNDYRLILPIMLATVICVYVAEKIEPHGIYMSGLLRKGIRLPQGREIDLMQGVTVGEAMIAPAPTIIESASLLELRDMLRVSRSNSLCVVDEEGQLSGIVTLSDLQRAYSLEKDHSQSVSDICTRDVIMLYPEDTVWTAIRAMSTRDIGRAPVVKRGTRQLIGMIGRHGVMRAYNIAIVRKLEDAHIAESIRLNTMTGAHVFEFRVAAGAPIISQHIAEIQWPLESTIASIRRDNMLIIPHGNTEIKANDLLTIVAEPSAASDLTKLVTPS